MFLMTIPLMCLSFLRLGGGVIFWIRIVGMKVIDSLNLREEVTEEVNINAIRYCNFIRDVFTGWLDEVPIFELSKVFFYACC